MRKILSFFIAILFASSMMAEVGGLYYTFLPYRPSSGAVSDYTKTGTMTIDEMNWTVPGNWFATGGLRLGGKSLEGVDRVITAQNPMGSAISKIRIAHAGKTADAITLNSITVTTASDADFTQDVTVKTVNDFTIAKNTKDTIDIVPATEPWAINSYYKFAFNFTNPNASNYSFIVESILFYAYAEGGQGGEGGEGGEEATVNYYIVGTMTNWQVSEDYKLTANPDNEAEYMFTELALTTASQFKVVAVAGEEQTWYPDGQGNNYGENGEIAADGSYDVYFRPDGQGGADWFYNVMYVAAHPEPQVDPVYGISGAWNNFDKQLFEVAADGETATFAVDLEAGEYEFKIRVDDDWLTKANNGQPYGLHREWNTIAVTDHADENLKLTADVNGVYVFTWTFSSSEIAITFPAVHKMNAMWKVTEETAVAAEIEYINNYALAVTNPFATTLKPNVRTFEGYSFTHAIQVRNAAYPSADAPAGTEQSGSTSLVITAKEDVEVAFFYNRQTTDNTTGAAAMNDNKDMKVFDQAAPTTALEGAFKVVWMQEDMKYVNAIKTMNLVKGHTYTVSAKGTTIQLHGIRYITDADEPEPAQPKFYITGNEDIVGEGNPTWGKNGALESFSDTLVMNLAAGFHKFKLITTAEQWLGMEALTDTAYGLFTDDDTNICFNIAEAGEVTVIYNATEFKVEGNFYVAPKVAYYLIGDSAFVVDAGATADKAWTPDAIASFKDTTVLHLKAGQDYIMRLSLNGTWENHRDFRHLTDTAAGLIELPDEFGNHSIGFSLAEAGDVTIIYIPATEEQPEVFKLVGDFYVAPAPDPTVAVMGSMNDWAEEIPFVLSDDKTYASLTVENIGADEYEFKFIINGEWRSNGYRFHREFTGAAGITENNKANMVFVADQDGEYTFYWYFANDSAAIVYPEYIEPAKEYYAKYAPAWEWTKLTEAEGLWLTDTIVYGGIGVNINDAAADENNMFYSNTDEEQGVRPIAGPEIDKGDTVYFSFNPADSVLTAVMVGKYVAPVVVPTVSVFGSMTRPAWEVEIPFELSEDKTYATLYNDNIKPGEYTFKLQVNGDWRSNGYRYHRDFPGAAGITGNADADMTFVADQEGEYTFTWFFANDSLAITYPKLPFTCDWDNIAWLDGSNEQIKVCKESEAVSVINVQKPGWAAEKGIYMTFPSAAWGAISLEEGSYVTEGAGLLVYLSALTQEYNEISIVCQDVEYIINVYNAANAPKPAFYLVGNFNEWTAAEAYKFALNPNNDAEYVLTATLAENDSLKVIRVMEGEETVWYPAEAENYVVDAAHAGEKDIYFRPDYQGGEDWYAQCIYVAENAPQGCDWDHIDFIGSAVPELADQFKLCKEGQYPSVINIQNSFGTEAGIYVTFPSAAFGEISMTEGTYAIQGAGMLLYCSAFTDVETEVSIVCDSNPIIFTVYNAEGSAPVVDPTVSVKGSMNDWAEEIPFVLSDDKTYASLTVENIGADEYEFKFIINGEWRSNGYRYHRGFPGAAGITENNEANMTFEADIDGEYTFYWYFANDSAAIVYPAKPEPVLANGYYLVGSMNEWTPAAENLFAVNPDNDAEYQLPINLAEGDEIKVVEVENDAIKTWFPNEGGNYIVDQNHAGATTMYFRPNYNGEEGWFAACIYVVPTSHTDIDNVNAAVEAVKIIRDGQLFIIKGEKMYNVMGQTIK